MKEYKVIKLINKLKESATETGKEISFRISYNENGYFEIGTIEVSARSYLKDFSYLENKHFEELLEDIRKDLEMDLSIQLRFFSSGYGEKSPIIMFPSDIEDIIDIKIDDMKLSKEEKSIMDLYKNRINQISISVYIDEYGKLNLWGNDINELKVVKTIKPIAEYINSIINVSDKLSDINTVLLEKYYEPEDLMYKLKLDLNNIKNTRYFDKFLRNSIFIKDNSVSLYYNTRDSFTKSRSCINIYHEGYFFRFNNYYYDDTKIRNSNFNIIHTFEDKSSIQSTASRNFYDKKMDNLTNGRGMSIVSKGEDLDLLVLFNKYLDNNIIKLLDRDTDFEIFLDKGIINKVLVKISNYEIFILGLNKDNKKVFLLDNRSIIGVDRNTKINKTKIKNNINKLIKDIGYTKDFKLDK